jgi:hypothetical protein
MKNKELFKKRKEMNQAGGGKKPVNFPSTSGKTEPFLYRFSFGVLVPYFH